MARARLPPPERCKGQGQALMGRPGIRRGWLAPGKRVFSLRGSRRREAQIPWRRMDARARMPAALLG